MVKSRTLPFVYDDQLPTRFGVLPRYAKDEDAIRWFEVPAVMMFHVANAWQEGNIVKLVSCCFDEVRSQTWTCSTLWRQEMSTAPVGLVPASLVCQVVAHPMRIQLFLAAAVAGSHPDTEASSQ